MTPKLYMDTSVPSAYYFPQAPDRQHHTRTFWRERLPDFDGCISSVVRRELADLPHDDVREKIESLLTGCTVLPVSEEAVELADAYIEQGIFPERFRADALHAAIASAAGIGYVVSWNFKHLVRVQTRREVNLVNALRGYEPVEIIAPPEL